MSAAPAGYDPTDMGRFYIDSGPTVMQELTGDMQNILGFAASGNIAAMQRVFEEQSSMLRRSCSAVLIAVPAPPFTPHHRSCPQVDGSLRTPLMLVGLCLVLKMCAARGELSDSSAAIRHCCVASLMQQFGSCNSREGPGWRSLLIWVRFTAMFR